MSAKILDGKALATKLREPLRQEIQEVIQQRGRAPHLAVVIIGQNPSSWIYIRNKCKVCAELAIGVTTHEFPEHFSQEQLLWRIRELNQDTKVDGILVQAPLPKQIHAQTIFASVDPLKDVDGFHPENIGRLVQGNPRYIPCTPAGIMDLLTETGVPLAGKKVLIVGRSTIVGKPIASLLLNADATVTIAHSKTISLKEECLQADILIAAVGKPRMIAGDWIKPGAIVIDVGINRVDGKMVGDVDFETAKERAAFITPVPGGVGPMTIFSLMRNTVLAARCPTKGA
jgi:methylenetetrahydrofolate dehydrogenase (NADP+) / methenyltetrahydrofolate cyclohydrolase